jgi:hypothetical protein
MNPLIPGELHDASGAGAGHPIPAGCELVTRDRRARVLPLRAIFQHVDQL